MWSANEKPPDHMVALSEGYRTYLDEEFTSFTQGRETLENSQVHSQLQVPLFSSLRAKKITDAQEFGPQYWLDNLISPVLFNSAVQSILHEVRNALFLEIGPHATLQGPIREICAGSNAKFDYVPTMLRGKNSTESLLSALGQLYQHDVNVDFAALYPSGNVLADLPAYPWSLDEKYWYEPRVSKEWRLRPFGHHELLGRKVAESTSINPAWRLVLVPDHVPWLDDHKVHEDTVMPFAAFVSMAGEAIRQVTGVEAGYTIKDARVTTALVIGEAPVEIVTALRQRPGSEYYEFNIASNNGTTWITHCEGFVKPVDHDAPLAEQPAELPRVADAARWFESFAKVGFNYGPKFQLLNHLSASTAEEAATAMVHTSEELVEGPFLQHPTAIDACLQLAIIAGCRGLPRNYTELKVPTAIDEIEVHRGASSMQALAQTLADGEAMKAECVSQGKALLRLRGLRFTLLPVPEVEMGARQRTDGAYLEWLPDFDFQDEAAALIKPPSDDKGTRILEEFALMCVADSVSRLKGRKPSNPHFEKYGRWMARKVEAAANGQSAIGRDASRLLSLSSTKRSALIAETYAHLSKIPCRAPYAVAINRIRDNIEGLYTGTVDAAQILMEDDILTNIYSVINFDYSRYISLMSNSRPALRILEIGAGAGGTCDTILSKIVQDGRLPPFSTYTYSDVSPGFVAQARDRFSDAPNIEYKVFDVSKDPLDQGLAAESYDLILAPYVVHATPRLKQALTNLKTVLKPNGRLLLSEPSTIGLSPNFIFGTFSSWWSGEADGREWEPFVSLDRWDSDLRASGFTGAYNVVYDAELPYRYWSTIITQPQAQAQASREERPEVVVVARDVGSKLPSDLAEELIKSGISVSKVLPLSDSVKVADEHDVIFTLDLEESFFDKISPQDWVTFKDLMKKCESNPSRKLLWLLPPSQKNCKDPKSGLSIGLLRSVRSELDLSLVTLEVDPTECGLADHVANVFHKVAGESLSDSQQLLPDREFFIENGTIHVGRYSRFSLASELSRRAQNVSRSNILNLARNLHLIVQQATLHGIDEPHVAENQLSFDPEASYIVTGGMGGLGRAICSWMAERGARFITAISRSAGRSSNDKSFIAEMQSMQCVLTPVAGQIQDSNVVKSAVAQSPRPVKGVIHLAMVLRVRAKRSPETVKKHCG